MSEPMTAGLRARIDEYLVRVDDDRTTGDVYLRDALAEVDRLRVQVFQLGTAADVLGQLHNEETDRASNAEREVDWLRKRIEVGTHIAQQMCQYFHGNADVFSYCANLHSELSGRETHYGVVYERLNTENARLHDEVRQLRQRIETGAGGGR